MRKLAQNGVTTPFPIQAATIPDALAGKDILAGQRRGSGKTLSFGLPTLATLAGGQRREAQAPRRRPHPDPRAGHAGRRRTPAVRRRPRPEDEGRLRRASIGNQIYALERGVDVLVATPGRLRDIINRGACSLENVQIAVLDEADQMSDLGFLPEVTELLDQVPAGGRGCSSPPPWRTRSRPSSTGT
ncbi:RNA helicase OS=Streptomyces tendae OX=1932 GN=GUR47_22090 PE=4 SV=1 [Streptomyces tendae]